MTVALTAHVAKGTAGTSTAIDTTAANLIVVTSVGFGANSFGTLTDSKGNTWTLRINFLTGGAGYATGVWECVNPTVGTGHTFTITGGSFPSFCVAAFSGVATSSPFGASTTAQVTVGNTSIQPGSLTPSTNGSLVLTTMTLSDGITGTVSINSSFTITNQNPHTGSAEGSALAYLVQATAGAVNPAWTYSGSTNTVGATQLYYLPAPGVAAPIPGPAVFPLIGLSAAIAKIIERRNSGFNGELD